MFYSPNETVFCPNCEEEWDGVAEDYVIPNRFGLASEALNQCGYCDHWFTCTRMDSGHIEIEETDEAEDDDEEERSL